jgi:hypothetical protein
MNVYAVSVDPGDNTGVAEWGIDGTMISNFELTHEEFVEWANDFDGTLSIVVCEDYVHRPNQRYEKKGSKMKASEGKGIARALAKRKGAKFVVQPSTVLRITALHSGKKIPSKSHISDKDSAYLHGFRYLLDAGIIEAVRPENY